MDNEHLCGGMVKDMYLEELNAPPFLRFVGDAYYEGDYENCKIVEYTWPLRAPST